MCGSRQFGANAGGSAAAEPAALRVAGFLHSGDYSGGVVDINSIQGWIALALTLGLLLVKAFALLDALRRPPEVFVAADKQTKNLWLLLLGLAVAADLLLRGPFGLINLLGTVAALVYLADVRPAVSGLTPRR